MEVLFKNIRCFSGTHIIPLHPLTLLLGENSTGKTTFLAILSCFSHPDRLITGTGFNEQPYNLGGFENIVRLNPKTNRRTKSFSIGILIGEKENQENLELTMTFKGKEGRIFPSNFELKSTTGIINLNFMPKIINGRISFFNQKKKRAKGILSFEIGKVIYDEFHLGELYYNIIKYIRETENKNKPTKGKMDVADLVDKLFRIYPALKKELISIAPIRTKPERTYDIFTDKFSPEGDHVPLRLSQLLLQTGKIEKDKQEMINALEEFGKDSGLYSKLKVKRLRRQPSSPFQVMVNVDDSIVNLVDVGYGLSQCLPIILEAIIKQPNRIFLLQQPEIHLHPRAQAALGTFFAKTTEKTQNHYLIETHSDYLIDRIRQEVSEGNIDPQKVGILFFDKVDSETIIHQMALDNNGNILGAPPSYRVFFLKEELNLLSRGDNDASDN